MGLDNPVSHAAAHDSRVLYRIGGIAAIALAAAYTIVMVIYAIVGAPPQGAEPWLSYLAGRQSAWSLISTVSEIFYGTARVSSMRIRSGSSIWGLAARSSSRLTPSRSLIPVSVSHAPTV